MDRLQKVIAACGYTSRRKAEELIKEGRVLVNGKVENELGVKVNPNDVITIDGETLTKESYVYYLLNKPRNVICSVSDEHGSVTVIDLIDTNKRIYPIGRLDYDTTGLLLLTNDGELANILMHPSNGILKKYVARLDKCMAITDYQKLKKGIMIDGRKCIPSRVKIKTNNTDKDYSVVEVTIVEGRNHIVKNLFKELGYNVTKLNRTEYGFLSLDKMPVGTFRPLKIKEVKRLYEYKSNN